MRIVIALGGNALLKRGEPMDAEVQRANARRAAQAIVALATEHELVLTHGNGPQIGLLALQAATYIGTTPYPLDILGAETEGMIGYLLEQELINAAPTMRVAALRTQTIVRSDDLAFQNPTKFVGPQYTEGVAQRVAQERQWTMARDGAAWRRVVPSPSPLEILELPAIKTLLENQYFVICAGGGGVPVTRNSRGTLTGIEAVIDKDRVAGLLAQQLQADCLLMLTDVAGTYVDWGTPQQRMIRRASPSQLADLQFAAGSMGPKIESAIEFAQTSGRRACIGALDNASDIIARRKGTSIEPGVPDIEYT